MISTLFALWLVASPAQPQFLDRPAGRIAFTDTGGGGRPVVWGSAKKDVVMVTIPRRSSPR